MSLLGKLLAIFNVLAAIGFFTVAVLDWSKRQTWETAVFRQGLVLSGLPLEDSETNLDGKPIVKLLSEETRKDVYTGVTGSQESTQVGEVQRVQKVVQGYVNAAPDQNEEAGLRTNLVQTLTGQNQRLAAQIAQIDREIDLENNGKKRADALTLLQKQRKELQDKQVKVNETLTALNVADSEKGKQILSSIFRERKLARVLLPFSSTSAEYEDLAQRTASSEDHEVGALQGKLDNLFSAALTGKVSSDEIIRGESQNPTNHTLNADERKIAAARVLYGLIDVLTDPIKDPGYPNALGGLRRVLAVSGMVNTARAAETQTQLLRKMTDDLVYAIDRDRSEFVVEQSRALNQVRDLADELRRQRLIRTVQEDLVQRQTTLVQGLMTEIDQNLPPGPNQPLPLGLKQRQASAENATKLNLDIQAKMEESLFSARKQLRDLGEQNRKLEEQIRELEDKAKSR